MPLTLNLDALSHIIYRRTLSSLETIKLSYTTYVLILTLFHLGKRKNNFLMHLSLRETVGGSLKDG